MRPPNFRIIALAPRPQEIWFVYASGITVITSKTMAIINLWPPKTLECVNFLLPSISLSRSRKG